MEDALVQVMNAMNNFTVTVLILVLMEDALVLSLLTAERPEQLCLNPCFNGRCTRTLSNFQIKEVTGGS